MTKQPWLCIQASLKIMYKHFVYYVYYFILGIKLYIILHMKFYLQPGYHKYVCVLETGRLSSAALVTCASARP